VGRNGRSPGTRLSQELEDAVVGVNGSDILRSRSGVVGESPRLSRLELARSDDGSHSDRIRDSFVRGRT
jgi:hypothetical protein